MVLAVARSSRRMAAPFPPVHGFVCFNPAFPLLFPIIRHNQYIKKKSLEHPIQINFVIVPATHFIPTPPPTDHSPVPFYRSFFSSPSFLFPILNISNAPTSSTLHTPHPMHRSYLALFSSCQWAHPAILGPLNCIISSKRYPSPLTSALAGCLPSSLNGLINPS